MMYMKEYNINLTWIVLNPSSLFLYLFCLSSGMDGSQVGVSVIPGEVIFPYLEVVLTVFSVSTPDFRPGAFEFMQSTGSSTTQQNKNTFPLAGPTPLCSGTNGLMVLLADSLPDKRRLVSFVGWSVFYSRTIIGMHSVQF